MTGRIVILSAFQDYRTKKRASIQHVADGLVAAGYPVTFISTRYSRLSARAGDSRIVLDDRSNRLETVNGVECYLWRTLLHPFSTGTPWIDALTPPLFDLYAAWPNAIFDDAIRRAQTVVVESSVAVIYLRRIRAANPHCRIIYYATDRLDTVGAHPYVQARLVADNALIDQVSVRSSAMAPAFPWARDRLYRLSFGIDPAEFGAIGPSPYIGVRNAVSVGSMLFDPTVFDAAEAVPDVNFHVIGCGQRFSAPPNVRLYDEMPFTQTLPYLAHATIGIAPYRPAPGANYLGESSLKLAQYEYFGLPAVCPTFALAETPSRFGYEPGDTATIVRALQDALAASGSVAPRTFPTWREVSEQLLHPRDRLVAADAALTSAASRP